MLDVTQIKAQAAVIGADGVHVGTVDHVQGDRIKLTKQDSVDEKHHYISLGLVVKSRTAPSVYRPTPTWQSPSRSPSSTDAPKKPVIASGARQSSLGPREPGDCKSGLPRS